MKSTTFALAALLLIGSAWGQDSKVDCSKTTPTTRYGKTVSVSASNGFDKALTAALIERHIDVAGHADLTLHADDVDYVVNGKKLLEKNYDKPSNMAEVHVQLVDATGNVVWRYSCVKVFGTPESRTKRLAEAVAKHLDSYLKLKETK